VRFHWYWPFARREELEWAVGTARDDDSILVQVIGRPEAPAPGPHGSVTVVRDLPDVERNVSGARWLASRALTYRARSAARRARWKRDDFDLVHLHYLNRFTDAFVAMPHPLVFSVHDVVPHVERVPAAVERRLLHRLYSRADALVVHHAALADRLEAEFAIPASRLHVVPHQVFPVAGEPAPPPPGEPPTILFFGALRPNKGVELLDGLMAALDSDDVRLVVGGRGDPVLEQRVRDLARRDARVTAEIGFATLERKRELFDAAAVVVLPYTSFSSQSGVLHDAYGHGRPVVVTDVGALGTSVREDGTGLVAETDPGALAEAIRAALEPATWVDLSESARRIARERTPAAVGARLREVYDVVLGSR
jgi:glycosyltransferase involved in cell wall biosynthesis